MPAKAKSSAIKAEIGVKQERLVNQGLAVKEEHVVKKERAVKQERAVKKERLTETVVLDSDEDTDLQKALLASRVDAGMSAPARLPGDTDADVLDVLSSQEDALGKELESLIEDGMRGQQAAAQAGLDDPDAEAWEQEF